MLRFLPFFLLLFVCLGIFAYCIPPSLRPIQLSSEGVGGEEYDDYDEGEEEECEEEDEEECEEDEDDEDEDIDEMDMPYDITVDTASYLSCNAKNLPDDAFKFQMSALIDGEQGAGVRLRQKFGKMEKDEIKQYPYHRSYPALIPIPRQWWVSPSNNNQNPVPSRYLSLPSVELEGYLDEFLENGEAFMNDFGRDILQLGWKANYSKSNLSFYAIFNSRYLLLSFYRSGRSGDFLGYRDIENSRETVHGRYYRVDMEEQEEYHTLENITERYPLGRRNLSRKENEWSCGIQLEVRRHDRHRYLAKALSAEPGCENNDDNSSIYELVHRILGDDWNINLRDQCVSLKNHRKSCYKWTHQPNRVRDGNQGKGRVDYSDCTGRNMTSLCPHYFSVCTRSKL